MHGHVSIIGDDIAGGTQIEVEGHRIEGGVRSLEISQQAGHPAQISLELGVFETVNVQGEVTIVMTAATREALIVLGWTPPDRS
jgi:hypothetical protein